MSVSATILILLTVVVRSVALEALPKTMFRFLWDVALVRHLADGRRGTGIVFYGVL